MINISSTLQTALGPFGMPINIEDHHIVVTSRPNVATGWRAEHYLHMQHISVTMNWLVLMTYLVPYVLGVP